MAVKNTEKIRNKDQTIKQ